MNELADDGFHEIQLSAKQLVFVVMAGTTLAVAIFLCGVQVGRNVSPARAVDGADALLSATPPAAATPSQPVAAGGPPAAEPPAPAPEPDDELSYAKRLQGDQSASAEKLKSPAAAAPAPAAKVTPSRPAPEAVKPPAKAEPAAAPQSTGRAGGWIVQITALQDRAACATIAQRLTAKGYPAFVLDPAPG